MKIPAITGVIRRRILLNYRVDPAVAQGIVPSNFRPKLVAGHAVAGICLIRLEQVRPQGLPAAVGIASENTAHRIAVQWQDDDGQTLEGVFVPRRDTGSRLNALAGGRVFPGVHHHSTFTVDDHDGTISVRVDATDLPTPLVDLQVTETDHLPPDSVFASLDEASQFFENGCIGYSARPDGPALDGLRLDVPHWQVTPLRVDHVRSAYYDDRSVFPEDSIKLDHALLMRDIAHSWHSEPTLTAI